MIGVFGGTFDPVHNGHLRIALDVLDQLPLSCVHFIPCKTPVHRDKPMLAPEQRLHLLTLAIQDQVKFVADDRELRRESSSYMIDTLGSLRDEFPEQPLLLMIGADAFAQFDQWHRWQDILTQAHLVLMQRPGLNQSYAPESYSAVLAEELRQRMVGPAMDSPHKISGNLHQLLAKKSAGSIICVPVTQLEISASEIRKKLKMGQGIDYLLPESVQKEVLNQNYYQLI
ncbi:Nicotinate-nucleotide adenylyltransferase [hydrothermal vent metagenome]|uniref:Nicotinate-nucleotide adenylyltransferase n=1 Tax=hydrothermal vent metagenome TaxID=652676 RepID=A0A3B0XV00_9ZZZZ